MLQNQITKIPKLSKQKLSKVKKFNSKLNNINYFLAVLKTKFWMCPSFFVIDKAKVLFATKYLSDKGIK